MSSVEQPVRIQVRVDQTSAKLPEPDRPKLSPMLRVAVESNLSFEGVAIQSGDAVYPLPPDMDEDTAISPLMDIEGVLDAKRLEEEFDPIDRLVVLYSDESVVHRGELGGMPVVDRFAPAGFVVVQALGGVTPNQLKLIGAERDLRYIEPSFHYRLLTNTFPNDPYFVQGDLWGLANMFAPDAWDAGLDGANIVVAVLDSGIDYNHPDLRDNMWRDAAGLCGYDFVPGSSHPTSPMDTFGHGTHCAGIIAAKGDNAEGVIGVAYKAKLMAVRIFIDQFQSAQEPDLVRAVQYAVSNGARILNTSWGSTSYSVALRDAFSAAEAQGALIVAAAGNSGGDNDGPTPIFPASYDIPAIIAVAALDEPIAYEALAAFSNYGQCSVDLAAPGWRIWSTTIQPANYAVNFGTSMAAAFVSGAAALLWGKNPRQTAADIKRKLMNTTRRIPAIRDRCVANGAVSLKRLAKRQRRRTAETDTEHVP